jgi:hypothetical protein
MIHNRKTQKCFLQRRNYYQPRHLNWRICIPMSEMICRGDNESTFPEECSHFSLSQTFCFSKDCCSGMCKIIKWYHEILKSSHISHSKDCLGMCKIIKWCHEILYDSKQNMKCQEHEMLL